MVAGTREKANNIMNDNLAGLLELVEFVFGIMPVAPRHDALVTHVVVRAVETLMPATDDGLSADIAQRVVCRKRSSRARSDWFGNG